MAAKRTAMASAKKIEKAAQVKIAKAQQGLTMTVGQAQTAAFKALHAAHKRVKVLTDPYVDEFKSAWKREVKRAKKAVKS